MKARYEKAKLPLTVSAVSLVFLLLLLVLTSPARDVIYSIPFFLIAYIFILAVGSAAVTIQTGLLSSKAKQRLVLLATFLIIVMMFSSSQSLSLVDAFILLLIGSGLSFYFNRR